MLLLPKKLEKNGRFRPEGRRETRGREEGGGSRQNTKPTERVGSWYEG